MRDPKRIRKFLNQLADIWETYFPDLRFGQLIHVFFAWMNTAGKEPFYIEDDEFLKFVKDSINKRNRKGESL